MNRYAEVVLNGHPDKFCDIVADRIIREMYKVDPEGYAQVEVSVWSDFIFLTGAVVTRSKIYVSIIDLVNEVGIEIGYSTQNHIDVAKYKILDHICWLVEDPCKWTHYVNDQCIVTGYAGYDQKTRFLPPEQYVCWYLRERIINNLMNGELKGQGPDGKILIILNEDHLGWGISTLLITLQQLECVSFIKFTSLIDEVLREAYNDLQQTDHRWHKRWSEIRVLINPNGPLLNGGSDGDNGQTGRKLVMDFYGPRVPIGGGALYGKDLSHIDRLGSFASRKYALELLALGSKEVMLNVSYAPGMNTPLDVTIKSNVKPHIDPFQYFDFREMHKQINYKDLNYNLINLGSFYNEELSFNNLLPALLISH